MEPEKLFLSKISSLSYELLNISYGSIMIFCFIDFSKILISNILSLFDHQSCLCESESISFDRIRMIGQLETSSTMKRLPHPKRERTVLIELRFLLLDSIDDLSYK